MSIPNTGKSRTWSGGVVVDPVTTPQSSYAMASNNMREASEPASNDSTAMVDPDGTMRKFINISGVHTRVDRLQRASQMIDTKPVEQSTIDMSRTVDWLTDASIAHSPFSLDYFLDEVDCPLISPFDSLNWMRMKEHLVSLASHNLLVARAIHAVQSIYRAQINHLPLAHAIAIHKTATISFQSSLEFMSIDLVLPVAFLFCLCHVILPNDDTGCLILLSRSGFHARLESWLTGNLTRSAVSLRICAWLQLLSTSTRRPGGSLGLLPRTVVSLLHNHINEVPPLTELDCDTHPERSILDNIASPMFNFYLQLQTLSSRVVDATNYRRPLTTAATDEQAVDDEARALVETLKVDLHRHWDSRPGTLRLAPGQLRSHFSRDISDSLVSLAGLCTAAYHAETILISRLLLDDAASSSSPPSPEVRQAMQEMRVLVNRCDSYDDGNGDDDEDGGREDGGGGCERNGNHGIINRNMGSINGGGGGGSSMSRSRSQGGGGRRHQRPLNPGYVRPLFVYSLEAFNESETRWAAWRLRQVGRRHPLSRAGFLAEFVEAHGAAQRKVARRVAVKGFCYQSFGVPLPFM